MAKKYYWLKLKEDFFTSKEMKKLRRLAGGDTYTIIYLKMLLLSMKNGGALFFDGIEDSFAEEIALDIDEDADNVKFTLMFLAKAGLAEEISEAELMLTQIPEMVGSETDKAALMRKARQRKRLESGNNVTAALPPVTNCYTEIEIEKDIEKEKRDRDRVDYQRVAGMYNETCVSFPCLKALSDNRKKAIKARLQTYTYEDFQTLFTKAEASDFLKGKNARNWQATFDWLIKDANMAKVLDGNYDNKGQARPQSGTTHKQLDAYMQANNAANNIVEDMSLYEGL